MKTKCSINVGGIICLVGFVYFTCKLLLLDEMLPFSICSMHASMKHWIRHYNVIAVGLLPVYVALVLFSSAIFGLFLGSTVQRLFLSLLRRLA